MQSSSAAPQAEAILEWLQQEMGYRPQSPYQNSEKLLPSIESLRKICRGNMLPVWKYLLERVKSEKTVEIVKRNILVHGSPTSSPQQKAPNVASATSDLPGGKGKGNLGKEKDVMKPAGRRRQADVKGRTNRPAGDSSKAKDSGEGEKDKSSEGNDSKEKALREREAAEFEVERLRHVLDRLQKDLKSRMLELSREEGERQRVLDDKYDSRHRQVMLEAYDERCEQAACIFAEYQRRLHRYVEHAMDVQRGKAGSDASPDALASHSELDTVYATSVKGGKPADGAPILIETVAERNVRKSCEALAAQVLERIKGVFPAYDGIGNRNEVGAEERKLGMDMDWELIPEVAKGTASSLLKNPPQLLRALAGYTAQILASIIREIEKIDIKADAERLRYRYENNRIIDDVSVDADDGSLLQSRGSKVGIKGTFRQLRERQRAHVQQFMATEEALNAAAEAKKASQELIRRIHGGSNAGDVSNSTSSRDYSQSTGSSRQFELDVWAKERELAGLKASVSTLTSEVQRLQKMCEERRAAEEALRKKWKRIEEFDGRRSELESIYSQLIHLNMAAASAWEQHTQRAREYSATTVIPLCHRVQQKAGDAHDLLEKEVAIFHRVPDNRLYMLPSTPQALLDSMGAGGPSGPESLAAAERQADFLTAKAGARDPSAIPSICRINAATQHISGYDGQDVGLYAVVEALRFVFSPCASPACLLEDLAKAMRQIQTSRNLVNNGRLLLSAANSSRPEHERNASACSSMASEQEKVAMEEWLPELKVAVQEAQKCLEDCKRVRGMVDEWWEQPASTAVDWITVDGQNVATWLAHVKQLQTAFYDKQLL
ncbi:hypothetical protein GOP47_0030475 [Adiantum capillus-veneris]|nr:hypothetical protein GOP47_0030475 [Adiantum capillus-veneris]